MKSLLLISSLLIVWRFVTKQCNQGYVGTQNIDSMFVSFLIIIFVVSSFYLLVCYDLIPEL